MKKWIWIVTALTAVTLALVFSACDFNSGHPDGEALSEDTISTENNTSAEDPTSVDDSIEIALARAKRIADTAYCDLKTNYWDASKGYFVDPYKDKNNGMPNGRDINSDIMWVYAQLMLSMETYAYASGDETFAQMVAKEFESYYTLKSDDWLLQCGDGNNPAVDDAAWSAMAFMLSYRWTGNEKSLRMAHDMIEAAYDYYQDGTTANGLFYQKGESTKSLYAVGLVLTELEYYEKTKGTGNEDAVLHQRTMDLYHWMEQNLRREGQMYSGVTVPADGLYFNDFDGTNNRPSGYNNPGGINWAGSCSSLFGNTGMAVVNKRLYEMTGKTEYLDKAVKTANALTTTEYNVKRIIMNDRDAWTNGAFLGFFAREVMPLEGIKKELGIMFLSTTAAIMKNAYYQGGYYGADWNGGTRWITNGDLGIPTWATVSATSTHMLFATYAALQNGSIQVTHSGVNILADSYTPKALPKS